MERMRLMLKEGSTKACVIFTYVVREISENSQLWRGAMSGGEVH